MSTFTSSENSQNLRTEIEDLKSLLKSLMTEIDSEKKKNRTEIDDFKSLLKSIKEKIPTCSQIGTLNLNLIDIKEKIPTCSQINDLHLAVYKLPLYLLGIQILYNWETCLTWMKEHWIISCFFIYLCIKLLSLFTRQ